MITFEQVSYTYPNADRPAFSQIDLRLPPGEFSLIVGPSGAGKSTLLRCLNGLTPHFSGGTLTGRIRVDGLDPVAAGPQRLSRHVGFVFQDPEAQFVLDRVEDELAFALENAAVPPGEIRVRVEETLDLLDLAALRSRRLDTLSGGERQRVAIASALAWRPQILALDEPTSQLDPQAAEEVLQALVRLNTDLGLTILLVEHRLERVLPYADRLIYLAEGVPGALSGPPAEILPHLAETPPLITLGRALGWEPLPLTIKAGRRFSLPMLAHRPVKPAPPPTPPPGGEPYLHLEQVEAHYNGRVAVRGASLSVWPGEIVAVMGRNGAGKTTLLKSMVGLVKPRRGRVWVAGEDVTGGEVARICRLIGYLPQDPNALLFADTVADELRLTLHNHRLQAADLSLSPEQLLARLGLADKLPAYPRDLSVGERQRVALGAIMVTQPGALLLDEPTRGLDYAAKRQLAALLREWATAGKAIVMVTHDVELAALVAARVVMMSQGEIIAGGSPAEILGTSPMFAPQVARLFPDTGWLTAAEVLAAK
jgi:energy-coupling factor transport system ATP-binding protein